MPFSQSSQMSTIIGWVEALKPRSILDVGIGMGQYGLLLRNNLENVNLFQIEGDRGWQRSKNNWQIVIDGIEGLAGCLTPVHEWAYSRIMIGEAMTLLNSMSTGQYELVMAINILEHLDRADGLRFLAELQRVASRAALVCTPKTFCPQNIPANPDENHLSVWSSEDLAANGFGELLPNDESWIAAWQSPHPAISRPEGTTPSPRWVVEWADKKDEADLLALFARAFGQAMPPDQWRWKYAAAEHWGTLVRKNGQIIAFYGGMPRPIRFFGKAGMAVQIGDVMVDPAQGRMLTRHGPFFLAASAYLERFIGPHKAYCLGFGFPSKRVNRLAEHLGLYESVGDVQEASWGPLRPRPHLSVSVRSFSATQTDLIEPLWQKMAADCTDAILPVRDGAYVRRRYLEHPTIPYLVFLARRRLFGRPFGLVVLRDHGDSGVELLDLVGPLDHLPSLVRIARQVTGALGRQKLFAWLTAPVAMALAASHPQLAALDVSIPTSIWDIPADVQRIRDRWWLMGGDADFR